jgi:predicted dehydrogenase
VDYWHGIKPTFAGYNWIRRREFAGGAMITGGCHAADVARYLKGEVAEVCAYSTRQREDFDLPHHHGRLAAVRRRQRGQALRQPGRPRLPYQFNIDLLGSLGAIRDNRVYSRRLLPEQSDFVQVPSPTLSSGSVTHHPFQQEIDNLVENRLQGTPVLPDVPDACRSQEVALAIEESAATGRPVALGPAAREGEAP